MAAKNTYTLRIKYDDRLRGRLNTKVTFKAMVDDQNNWKSLDAKRSPTRREAIDAVLRDCKEIGEEYGDAMMVPPFFWHDARFAVAVMKHSSLMKVQMLSFAGPDPQHWDRGPQPEGLVCY